MSVKDTEYKMTTTYHAQMRHQSKYRLELDVADYECERQWMQEDNDLPRPDETSE